MTARKTKRKRKSNVKPRTMLVANRSTVPAVVSIARAVPEPATDVVTEKTYITTEPEVEIRKPATLAQALTEPGVAVVKRKTRVRKEIQAETRRRA